MKYAAFRGNCSVCGWDYTIRRDGTVVQHPASEPEYNDGTGRCRGGLCPPQLNIKPPEQN
jgi:hypothetical protein